MSNEEYSRCVWDISRRNKMKVKYENLSGWLKAAVICMWITLGWYALAFLYGFFGAL